MNSLEVVSKESKWSLSSLTFLWISISWLKIVTAFSKRSSTYNVGKAITFLRYTLLDGFLWGRTNLKLSVVVGKSWSMGEKVSNLDKTEVTLLTIVFGKASAVESKRSIFPKKLPIE